MIPPWVCKYATIIIKEIGKYGLQLVIGLIADGTIRNPKDLKKYLKTRRT